MECRLCQMNLTVLQMYDITWKQVRIKGADQINFGKVF